jgi:hypothetical protein
VIIKQTNTVKTCPRKHSKKIQTHNGQILNIHYKEEEEEEEEEELYA